MSEPFLGAIHIFGFNFAPRNYATCDGQILPINQNQSLYSLLGTTYGGDGRTTFGLPDLRGRVPVHVGTGSGLSNRSWGERGGAETHTLTANELPAHDHGGRGTSAAADNARPGNRVPATTEVNTYKSQISASLGGSNNIVNMASTAGNNGNQAHENMQPFLTINFCIALQGLFPSRN